MQFAKKCSILAIFACLPLAGCGSEAGATPRTTAAASGDVIPPEALAAAQAELDQVAQAELAEQAKTAPPARGNRSRSVR